MNKMNLYKISAVTWLIFPLTAMAADLDSVLLTIGGLLSSIIPILMILATVVFLWGVIKYVTAGGDEEGLKSGRQFMIFGLIGLFVMVAVWGIVNLLTSTFLGGDAGNIPVDVGDFN